MKHQFSLLGLLGLALLTCAASALGQASRGSNKGILPLPAAQEKGAEQRVALIIGNANYQFAPLANPLNDARDIASTLREVGFEVRLLENANQSAIKRAIFDFGRDLRKNGGVGLFYYSGHGMQVTGRNWMIPLGARIEVEQHVEVEGIDAARVLAEMEAANNRLNIVILDACRNNPFIRAFRSGTQGLATMDAPSGTLIAYATAPGRVAADGIGENSPFTGELVRAIRSPGLKLEEVFKRTRIAVKNLTNDQQIPWESSSLTGDFYFKPPSALAPLAPLAPVLIPPSTPAAVASSGAAGIGWPLYGGLGLLAYGALEYSSALELNDEAYAYKDTDQDKSQALEKERDTKLIAATSAAVLGLGLIWWELATASSVAATSTGTPSLQPALYQEPSGALRLKVAAQLRW